MEIAALTIANFISIFIVVGSPTSTTVRRNAFGSGIASLRTRSIARIDQTLDLRGSIRALGSTIGVAGRILAYISNWAKLIRAGGYIFGSAFLFGIGIGNALAILAVRTGIAGGSTN